ncbi:MAG: DUF1501 domain-containing protein [Gemmataceae bacterium]
MLSIRSESLTRRETLRIGGLGFTGLAWPRLLHARETAPVGSAKSCIIIFNYGGPSHIETLDPKPDAPSEIRGEFKPIATSVPGIAIAEHLPLLAKSAKHFSVIRSITHRDNDHAIGAYYTLTGHHHPKNAILGIEPPATPQDLPSIGSVVSKLRPPSRPVFPYVTLGELRHFGNFDSLGQNAGCLGKTHEPFQVPFNRPLDGTLDLRGVADVMGEFRSGGRRQLLDDMNRAAPALQAASEAKDLNNATRRAFDLLASPATREAFDLSKEPQRTRDAYGRFAFGRNCLLARRLVEAGVPLVTLYSFGNRDWDTHGNNFKDLKNTLLPPTDRGVSSLLEDLAMRGRLDDTLVVWMSDMGRTPRVNKDAGRDHWSFCYSILMAGGGVRGGQAYGASDRGAAYPSVNPVSPADVAATILHLLGIDPRKEITDQQGRPFVASTGSPIQALFS